MSEAADIEAALFYCRSTTPTRCGIDAPESYGYHSSGVLWRCSRQPDHDGGHVAIDNDGKTVRAVWACPIEGNTLVTPTRPLTTADIVQKMSDAGMRARTPEHEIIAIAVSGEGDAADLHVLASLEGEPLTEILRRVADHFGKDDAAKRREWMRHRIAVLTTRRNAYAVRLAHLERAILDEEITRASGETECAACGLPYYDHPEHPVAPWATVMCDGSLVKL